MNNLNVGIIGCGKVFRDAHLPVYRSNADITVKAYCDTNEEGAKSLMSKAGSKATYYKDYLDMLEKEELDFVDICTPGFSHYQICKDAIKHGVHFITEKPPALSLDQFEELKSLASGNNVKTGVMLNYRYKDFYIKLKNYIDDGTMGEIKKIQTIHHGPCVFNDASWLWDEKKSFYLLYEYGIHSIDMQVYLCGPHEKILFVNPTYVKELNTTTDIQVLIKYKNGATGIIDFTSDSMRHSSFFTWMNVYGTGNDAFVSTFPPSIKLVSGIHNPVDNLFHEVKTNMSIGTKILTNTFQKYRNESHSKVLNAFANSVRNDVPFQLSFDNITNTMKLLEDIKANIPSYK